MSDTQNLMQFNKELVGFFCEIKPTLYTADNHLLIHESNSERYCR